MSALPFPSVPHPDRVAPPPSPGATLRDVVGGVLRDERGHQGRTLTDVAGRAGVSVAYLSEVERGRKDASADVLAAVSAALELPLPTLLDRAARRLTVHARSGMFALAA